jgi:hypothetical protein
MECNDGCSPLSRPSSPPGLGTYDGVTDLVDLQDGKRLGNVERDMRPKPVCCNPLINYVLGTDGEINKVIYSYKKCR